MTNGNDPAFPKLPLLQSDQGISWPGLTKREYFAAMAMMGLLSDGIGGSALFIASEALLHADALIAELSK